MEGTAHIEFSRFETTEAIYFKIFSIMHMSQNADGESNKIV